MNLEEQFFSTVSENRMIRPGERIVIGISGGADSVCLACLLAELVQKRDFHHVQIRAVHVHHGLRKTADRDADYVKSLCQMLGIPLQVCHVNARQEAERNGMSVEEAGRALRYQSFENVCRKWDQEEGQEAGQGTEPSVIAVAHHMEDCAETVLFQLCRGSSIGGLSGIQPVSSFHGIRIIRPLIESSRDSIEQYLNEKGISWCEDETNRDTGITRNYIRLHVIPELNEHVNHASVQHIVRTAREMEEAESFLQKETEKAEEEVKDQEGAYRVSGLKSLPLFLQKRVLYKVIVDAAGHRKDITSGHVAEVQKLLRTSGCGKINLPYKVIAVKEYDHLSFHLSGEETTALSDYPLRESQYRMRVFQFDAAEMEIPADFYTKWFDYDKITYPVQFRTRQKGDSIVLDEEGHCAKLTRVMIDRHVPERIRDSIVLPMNGSHVLWFPGYRIGADCRIDSRTQKVLEIKLKPE